MASTVEQWWQVSLHTIQSDFGRLAWVGGAFASVTLIEFAWPAERGQGLVGRVRNLLYAGLLVFLGYPALTLVYLYLLGPDDPSADQATLLGTIGSVFLTLLAIDFLYYWYHRAQHRWPWLWRVHELHHADRELNITTSMRTYWLEHPIQAVLVSAPAFWMVRPGPEAAVLVTACGTALLLFSHANLRLHLGPVTPFLVGPQVHRFHHSIEPRHRDCNFAQFFPVLDVVFGTYVAPGRDQFPRTGTEDLATDAPLWRVLSRPFLWWWGKPTAVG